MYLLTFVVEEQEICIDQALYPVADIVFLHAGWCSFLSPEPLPFQSSPLPACLPFSPLLLLPLLGLPCCWLEPFQVGVHDGWFQDPFPGSPFSVFVLPFLPSHGIYFHPQRSREVGAASAIVAHAFCPPQAVRFASFLLASFRRWSWSDAITGFWLHTGGPD